MANNETKTEQEILEIKKNTMKKILETGEQLVEEDLKYFNEEEINAIEKVMRDLVIKKAQKIEQDKQREEFEKLNKRYRGIIKKREIKREKRKQKNKQKKRLKNNRK